MSPPLKPPLLPSHHSWSSQSTSPISLVLYSNFPSATYFTHGKVYASMVFSQFVPPSSSPQNQVFLLLPRRFLILWLHIFCSSPIFPYFIHNFLIDFPFQPVAYFFLLSYSGYISTEPWFFVLSGCCLQSFLWIMLFL